MTEELEIGRSRKLSIYAWIIIPVVLLVGLLWMTVFRGTPGGLPDKDKDKTKAARDTSLAEARSILARQNDLTTCRTAIGLLNTHVQNTGALPILSTAQKDRFKTELGLDDSDLAEMNAPSFTPLDARHLEACFLLRDAARSLELVPPTGKGGKPVLPTPLERAKLAFDWVCRQVRLAPSPIDPLPAPPGFVLRRGSGSALERAVVFLTFLEQFGLSQDESASLQGCLVFLPGKDAKNESLWACGVVPANEPKSIYLFDPRMGLPLPGPGGKGIATLKQTRDDPTVLKQLVVEGFFTDRKYDITTDAAKTAVPEVYAPLTALSPRIRFLQDKLLRNRHTSDGTALPAAVRVRLAEEEPGALTAVRAAFKASGGKDSDVKYWKQGATILRSFVFKDEGGSDTRVPFPVSHLAGFTVKNDPAVYLVARAIRAELASVPWEGFPPDFRNPTLFRYDRGLGSRIRDMYAGYFLRSLKDPNGPRERIIRGQFGQTTAQDLVREQEDWQQAKSRRLDPEEMKKGINSWVERALEAYANQERAGGPKRDAEADAQVAALWQWRVNDAMYVLMTSSAAPFRGADVTFQLGLCKHEEAVRAQGRLDLASRAGLQTQDEQRKAREAWEQASYWWKQYLANYSGHMATPAVRLLRGEAQLGAGEREAALATWSDTSKMTNDLEALAMLWRGKQGK